MTSETLIVQVRQLESVDIIQIRELIADNPSWIQIGTTTGWSRQDRSHALRVSVKDVYLYPLDSRYRKELSS
jgi:hypothetical protein